MVTRRTYGDGCAIARALDFVGERWALLLVRELLLGPKRYTALRGGLPNASPNVLSERLRELEGAGIIRRRTLPPPASVRVYELTEWGRDLEDIVIALGRWGAGSPTALTDVPTLSADSVVLALRARFDPAAGAGIHVAYGLRLGEDQFQIDISDDQIFVSRGESRDIETVIETDPGTLGAILWGSKPLADAQHSGTLTAEGDQAAVERFMRLFPIPAGTVSTV